MLKILAGLFSGISWIPLAVSGGLALVAGGYVGFKTDNALEEKRIAVIDATNAAAAIASRDRIRSLSNDLAVCRDTTDKQDKAIMAQNSDVAAWKGAAKAATQRAQAAIADAEAGAREAQELAAALAARKPQNGSYADLVKLIQEPTP